MSWRHVAQWVQVGVEHVAVNESGAVCGRLIPLNDEFIVQGIKRPENGVQKVRGVRKPLSIVEQQIADYKNRKAAKQRA